MKKEVKIAYVLGLKWWDRVNGNTYFNSLVYIDNKQMQTGFQYGYGNQYYYEAKKLIDDYARLYDVEIKIVDIGSMYTLKTNVKNGWVR